MKNRLLDSLKTLSPILKDIKLIESFDRARQHHDEPKFWNYSAFISDKYLKHDGNPFHSTASGVSFFSQEKAVLKSLAEAIERYSNFAFFDSFVAYEGSYSDIGKNAINPQEFVFFSDEQLRQNKYKKFRIDNNSFFRWTKIKSLTDKKSYLIPCQSIYLSYKRLKNEPVLYPSISTGTAGHFNLNEAILNGIYEILERDAFMIYYLSKITPSKYDLMSSTNKKIKTLLEIAKRYNLEVISLDVKTDLNIPTVVSVIIDRSGLSKAVSVGLKCHLDTEKAIIGSINEAFHTRTWIRESYIENPREITTSKLIKESSIKNRGLLWYSTKTISKLDFLVGGHKTTKIRKASDNLSVKKQITKLKKILAEKGYKIYYKDITSKYFENIPFKVVKVVIPGMQPVYLNEKYPLHGGKRLQTVPEKIGYPKSKGLNSYPHPFL